MLSQMTQEQNFIFSTDSYHEDSIKGQKRARRGTADQIILDGPAIRRPNNLKLFLSKDRNKEQLCHMLKKVWGNPEAVFQLLKCSTAILVVAGKAYCYKCSNMQINVEEVFSLCSNQEESNTRFILFVNHAKMLEFKNVVIRSP